MREKIGGMHASRIAKGLVEAMAGIHERTAATASQQRTTAIKGPGCSGSLEGHCPGGPWMQGGLGLVCSATCRCGGVYGRLSWQLLEEGVIFDS